MARRKAQVRSLRVWGCQNFKGWHLGKIARLLFTSWKKTPSVAQRSMPSPRWASLPVSLSSTHGSFPSANTCTLSSTLASWTLLKLLPLLGSPSLTPFSISVWHDSYLYSTPQCPCLKASLNPFPSDLISPPPPLPAPALPLCYFEL